MDDQTEKMIQDKGLTAPRVTQAEIDELIKQVNYHIFPGTTVTVCCITLENGYNVIGSSACASIENFDIEIGAAIALKEAKNKIWQLEGYLLREKLYNDKYRNEVKR